MRILCIYRHYRPDTTPYASILHAMLQRLVADGHEVTAFAAQPSYNDIRHPRQPMREELDGVQVRRIWLLPERKSQPIRRSLNVLIYLAWAICFSLRNGKYDLVLGSSYPPVAMGAALRLIRFLSGTPYIYHCQDLHPECATLAAKLPRGLVTQCLQSCELRNRLAADRIAVLSEDMLETLQLSGIDSERIRIINNFSTHPQPLSSATTLPISTSDASPHDTSSTTTGSTNSAPFRIMFAGNLGSFQALHRIIDAAHILEDKKDIQFIFMGQGEQRAALQKQSAALNGRTVHFIDYQKPGVAFSCMEHTDLGIVSLSDGIYRVAFPSKMMTYLAAGLPILAVVEAESALASLVQQHELGYVTRSTTPADIAKTILAARNARRAGEAPCRQQIRSKAQQLFGKEAALNKWSQLVNELAATQHTGTHSRTHYGQNLPSQEISQRRTA